MFLLRLRNRHFLILDLVLLALTPTLAMVLRVGLGLTADYTEALALLTGLSLLVKLPTFYGFGLYNRYWRYASIEELVQIFIATATAAVITAGLLFGLLSLNLVEARGFPRSAPLIDAMLTLLLAGGTRFSVRVAEHLRSRQSRARGGRRVLIVGAGEAGLAIAREAQTSREINLMPIGFVDDNREKVGTHIFGLPVLGTRAQLVELVTAYGIQEVIIAMPTAAGKVIREIVRACDEVGVPSRTLPGIFELLSDQASVSRLRRIEIQDLLRREAVEIESAEVRRMIAGRRVLVTGAGGSIGTELCQQILLYRPALLIAVGHGENSLHALAGRLRQAGPVAPPLELVVADVRDRPRLSAALQRLRPQIIFHAAAHKHVDLMEHNVEDAVSNNVLGTRHVLECAAEAGVERCVVISSDKAVNPASVMGATKRVAELLVHEAALRTRRPYVSVRFGNVLGSRGSVVPVFQRQIAAGGPVTVTHPDIERYFMTIPEAVQLVLQAGALGECGEVFVLDMGQPVRIQDLARDLIELSGLQVGRDIDIVFTGLRPGEKMAEELFRADEAHTRTKHDKIFVIRNDQPARPEAEWRAQLEALLQAAQAGDTAEVRRVLQQIVPEYRSES
jgi:FlaA1/EpsC-like NDP-sugar epimerase